MSCLNHLGKKLHPAAKKAWKSFTSKLHTKLTKLNNSKAIKKPKHKLKTITKALSFQPCFHQRKRGTIVSTTHILRCCHLQKRPAPIYIDKLFIEPPVSVVEQHLQRLPGRVETCKGVVRVGEESTSRSSEEARPLGQLADEAPGPSMEVHDKTIVADDMWESLGLASPLMHGINERAEEFIARIRSEMQLQELMMAHQL